MDDEEFYRNKENCNVIDRACMNRRFFVTRKGYMGLAPATAQKGDLVCILFGGNIPFILRRVGPGYELIGQAYVHGIMAYDDGEMEMDIKKKRIEVQDFFIT